MSKYKKPKFGTAIVNISLNCLLFQDGEKNYEFTIITNIANSIGNFKKNIKKKIRAVNNIFNDIEANQLILWQVLINNSNKEKFSNLNLVDVKSKNIKKLEGIIGNYWTEQPFKEFTHVIIYCPYLTILQKLDSLIIPSQEKKEEVKVKNQKKLNINPEKLGDRNIFPVLDSTRFKLLNEAKNKLLMKFKKKIPFSCVCEALVDNKEVIVAFVNQLEGTPVHLPVKFENFPVLISYEAIQLHHCSFQKE